MVFKRLNIEILKSSKGFTLLEMIISIGLFSVIVTTAISVMLQVSNAQLKASNVQTILDNIRFSLELITKEMRTGNSYAVNSACGTGIAFKTSLNEDRAYFLDASTKTVMRATLTPTPADCDGVSGIVQPFTSEDVEIDRLDFQIRGQTSGPDDGQPWVVINLSGKSKGTKYQLDSSLGLQTTITQRIRDLK
ncbi:MAG: prepilin-type N-terminal cleavage/methylation domain-containing protein [bacterium]|nr:prepilin-type N-terminal cleavage/methylation domain-containing protein [bacterium]